VSLQNYLDAKNRKSDKPPPLFSLSNTDMSKKASQNHLRDIDEYLEFYENLQHQSPKTTPTLKEKPKAKTQQHLFKDINAKM